MDSKICKKCGEKINNNFDYCPYCGNTLKSFNERQEEWGMLGKNDLNTFEESDLLRRSALPKKQELLLLLFLLNLSQALTK